MKNILEVTNLNKIFKNGKNIVKANDNVSFVVPEGKIVGLIGESGSGKTTLGRTIMNLYTPDSGFIKLYGKEIGGRHLSRQAKQDLYWNIQMIFQDPYSSLNGQKNILTIVAESLKAKKLHYVLFKNLMKNQKDILFYFSNELKKFYFQNYWEYRLYANKIALEAYKEIKENLEHFHVDPKLNLEENYKKLSMGYFEIKELANYKIITKLNNLVSILLEEWEKRQKNYQKGFSLFEDEKRLIQANLVVTRLSNLMQKSEKNQKLFMELRKLEKELLDFKNGHKFEVKKTRLQIRTIRKNLYLERKILNDKKWSTKTIKYWNYYIFLIEINKTFSKVLGFLKRYTYSGISPNKIFGKIWTFFKKSKRLEIIPDLIYEKIKEEYTKKFQQLFLDNSPVITETYKKSFLQSQDINNLKKSFVNSNSKFKKYHIEVANQENKISNIKKELDLLKLDDAKRNIIHLKDELIEAQKKAKECKKIFINNLKEYKDNFQKELNVFNEKHKTLVSQKIIEITTFKKETKKLFKQKFQEIQKLSKYDNKSFKTKIVDRRQIKNTLRTELISNNDLDIEIKLNFKGLSKIKILYGIKGQKIYFWNKGKFIKELVKQEVFKTLEAVGLSKSYAYKYPHEFSGGMRQRVGIARALISNPKLIIADEPIAALDLSIQAQIVNLLMDLKKQRNLSMIFIAHDLSMVEYNSDYVLIMHLGKIVEYGKTEKIFDKPIHPYTRNLMEAIPDFTNIKEKFKENHFMPNYLNDYSIFNQPTYHKVRAEHYVFGTPKQFKLWVKSKK